MAAASGNRATVITDRAGTTVMADATAASAAIHGPARASVRRKASVKIVKGLRASGSRASGSRASVRKGHSSSRGRKRSSPMHPLSRNRRRAASNAAAGATAIVSATVDPTSVRASGPISEANANRSRVPSGPQNPTCGPSKRPKHYGSFAKKRNRQPADKPFPPSTRFPWSKLLRLPRRKPHLPPPGR